MSGTVMAVSRSATHTFTKPNADGIRLVAGLGVEGAALGLVAAMVISEADARRSVHRLYPVVPGADVAAQRGLLRDAVYALCRLQVTTDDKTIEQVAEEVVQQVAPLRRS